MQRSAIIARPFCCSVHHSFFIVFGVAAAAAAVLPAFPAAGGGPYSATVTTPVTDFNLRANSVVREPQIQDYWQQHQVYERLAANNAGVSYSAESSESSPVS